MHIARVSTSRKCVGPIRRLPAARFRPGEVVSGATCLIPFITEVHEYD